MKKHIPTITIFFIIIGIIVLGIYFSEKNSPINELTKLGVYSEEELSFLEEQGFLDNINSENLPSNKEQIISLLKSSALIEQNLNSPDESFEVLATKLDENTYQLAFKLENKSNQSKEFYLIPVSEASQTEFKEIKGSIKGKAIWGDHGDWTYDIEKHKQELRPELAQAYDDIEKNGYIGKPIKLVLEANSTLLAQSKWEIIRGPSSDSLKPVYLLVYGSAGGAKDELTILTVHSSPQQGENWAVEFTTSGIADLRIIPNDQATIDDDEFIGLYCNDEKRIPQILPGDIIFYPDWECLPAEALAKEGNGIGKVVHHTKKAGKHTLRFEFGGQTAFAYNSPGLIDNLISYWKFDDNLSTNVVLDAHGSNDGTVVNDQTNYSSEQSTTGKIVRAFDLDGTNDYVDTSLASNSIGGGNFTLSAWFKTDIADVGDDWVADRLITTRDTASSSQIGFGQNNTTIAVFWDDGAGNLGVGTTTLSTATWYFGTLTYDGSTIRIYLNAVEENNFAEANLSVPSSDTVLIGSNNPTQRMWDGQIDEVGIWDRALSPSEVTELWNSGDGLAYPFTEEEVPSVRIKGSTIRIRGAKVKIK